MLCRRCSGLLVEDEDEKSCLRCGHIEYRELDRKIALKAIEDDKTAARRGGRHERTKRSAQRRSA